MRRPLLALVIACTPARPNEPLEPIAGELLVGAPWPVAMTEPLAMVKVYTLLDGTPVAADLMIACDYRIGGLGIEREFRRAPSSYAPDAIVVADPVDHAVVLAARWLQHFERQGFEVQLKFGGTADAIAAMNAELLARKQRGEQLTPSDLPAAVIDRAQLRTGSAHFIVVTKRGDITRAVSVSSSPDSARVLASEDLACPVPRMIDLETPAVILR